MTNLYGGGYDNDKKLSYIRGKDMKKLFAIIMSVLMISCFMPSMAFAASSKIVSTADELISAIADAKDGDTIKLGEDIEISSDVYSVNNRLNVTANNVTIDLNKKTLTASNCALTIVGSNITVRNGKMIATKSPEQTTGEYGSYTMQVKGKNVLVDHVTMTGGVNVSGENTENANDPDASVTISYCDITATRFYTACAQRNSTVAIDHSTLTRGTEACFWIEKQGYSEDGDPKAAVASKISYEYSTVTINGDEPLYNNTAGVPPVVTGLTVEGADGESKTIDALAVNTAAHLNAAIETGKNVMLASDITADVTIPTGKEIVLDLNGKTLTNVSNHTITNNGTLTIIDSSEEKTGQVDNVTHARAALYNAGKATLNGGTYTRSKENGVSSTESGGNSFYNIQNHGTMTIRDGVAVTQDGHFSSMIINGDKGEDCGSTLTIQGGTFSGGINTVKNGDYGTLEISGGTFSNTSQYVVQNWNVAEISGGSFKAEPDARAVLMTSAYQDGAEGELTVTGGTFTATGSQYLFETCYKGSSEYTGSATVTGGKFGGNIKLGESGTLSITGGLFNTKPDSTYCADGLAVVASGNSKYPFTVEKVKIVDNVEVVKEAKAEATSECSPVIVDEKGNVVKIEGDDGETKKISEAISAAVGAVAPAVGGTTATGLDVVATTEAKDVTAAEVTAAKTELTNASVEVATDATVSIYVQPYLDIKITGNKITTKTTGEGDSLDATATVTELTLDIVPMVKTIASTADSAEKIVTAEDAEGATEKTQNAVEIGTAKEVKVTTPVTITIPLPSGFVNSTGDKLYIEHTKSNGTSYVYTADITSSAESASSGGAGESGSGSTTTYYATFTNPNGFSQFLITKEDASVAKIEGVGYTGLSAALAAAEDGDTVTVLKDGLTASMSGSTRTIKLVNGMTGESDADSINVTINGKKIELSKNGEGESFTYTKRSSSGGSSAAVTPPAGDEAGDTAKTDEEIAKENAAKAAELASALKLTARSEKTAKGNIKVTLTVDGNVIKAVEDLGYTVKYKFYRSTKKSASYKAKYEKAGLTYTNTAGTKGTRYYYKARVMVYDAQGALVTKTELKQCKYACRIWK